MFDALSTMDHLELDDIAALTKLNVKRVKEQMASDLKLGMVQHMGDSYAYTLTSAGMDLLVRFKAYKRAHGQPLPTADDPHSGDDRDDAESDDQFAEQATSHSDEDLTDYSIADDDGQIRSNVF